MGILKRVKYEIFFIGILAIMLGGCGNPPPYMIKIKQLNLTRAALHYITSDSGYYAVSTELVFLEDNDECNGTYTDSVTLYDDGIPLARFSCDNMRIKGKKGSEYPCSNYHIDSDTFISPGRPHHVYVVSKFIKKGKKASSFTLTSETEILEITGSGSTSGYSIEAVSGVADTALFTTIGINEQTDIPYSLPILFRTKYNGEAQNGIWVTFNYSSANFGNTGDFLYSQQTSQQFLNQTGIVKAVFTPHAADNYDIFASTGTKSINIKSIVPNKKPKIFDFVKVRAISDDETSGLGHSCTHRRASYPDGPEIKGDGLDDGNGTKGHPGLCTRDILGIDNATIALKGYLMDTPPWSNQKKQGGTK